MQIGLATAVHELVSVLSPVGTAAHYGLDGLGIESQWWRDFPHLSRLALGPTSHLYSGVTGVFPGDKAVGAWRWSPTPSSAEVKGRVELYLSSPVRLHARSVLDCTALVLSLADLHTAVESLCVWKAVTALGIEIN